MLKRPTFLKYLIISYLVFAIYAFIQYMLIVSTPIDSLEIARNAHAFSTTTVASFVFLFQTILTITLFYNLLALRPHGWSLQVSFSFFYIYTCSIAILNQSPPFVIEYITEIPKILLLPWLFFNIYIVHYFLRPEIRELFFNSGKQQEIKTKEFDAFINYTNSLIDNHSNSQPSKQTSTPETKHKRSISNIKYIPTARVLIATPKSIAELNKIQELNKAIDRNSTQIIVMLKKILPQLKESSVIDDQIYEHYQRYSWTKEDIIKSFKQKASELCTDKSNFHDKIFQYSKKIDELELLNKTEYLMDSWLKDTGNEIGDLISYNYI